MGSAYLDESGSLTTHEGTRPAHESISVKDVICKVDVNRDGVLAAASARKLDKGGYSLQEQVAVALCSQDPGVLDVDKALAELLCASGSALALQRTHLRASHVAPEPKVVFKPPPAELADKRDSSRHRQRLLRPCLRATSAATLYVYQKDGAWRLQNPNQRRMLVKIKRLDLSSVPYLMEGSRFCFSLGLRPATSLSRRRRAARLSPLRRRPLPSRPSPFPVSLAVQARRRLREAPALRSLKLLRPERLAASPAGPPVPTPKAGGPAGAAVRVRVRKGPSAGLA